MLWNLRFFRLLKGRLCLYQGVLLLAIQTPCFGGSLFSATEPISRRFMPVGDEFPGSVPKDAERINKTIRFSLHPGNFSELRLHSPPKNMQSTGLYRVPGKPVTIKVQPDPDNVLNQMPYLRIGTHTDPLEAIPEIELIASDTLMLEKLAQKDRDRASGLIYLESDAVSTDSFEVTISGVVKAPWFKLGRDSLAQWCDEIRHYPAPWAELEGEHAILTLPSAMIRDLDDPEAVINAYDQLVKDANALVGLSPDADEMVDKAPDLPFRFVLDVQTDVNTKSHAGYPIVLYWLEYGTPFVYVDPDDIRSVYVVRHELGHNYEPRDRAFEPPGAGQAFADLFIYGYQYKSGYWLIYNRWSGDIYYHYLPLFEYLWDLRVSSVGEGYDSTIWNQDTVVMTSKKSAFMIALVTALTTEPVTKLYQQFRRLPEEQIATSQQEKTNYFFESLCEITGRDLTLLFRSWRVPVSPEAYQRVYQKGYGHPRWLYHDGL